MEIYAPLAHRLGFPVSSGSWKIYLSVTSIQLSFTRSSHDEGKTQKREALVDEVVTKLEVLPNAISKGKSMVVLSISIRSTARCRIRRNFEEIYDLIAICILDTQSDVYMLGYVHELWKPMPGRFKDYIANQQGQRLPVYPYNCLWTKKGRLIRTKEMHEVAEYGVAAHWAYKKKESGAGQQQGICYWNELDQGDDGAPRPG